MALSSYSPVVYGQGIVAWAPAQTYVADTFVEDQATEKIYRVVSAYTSGATVDADVLAGNLIEVSPSEPGISEWATATAYGAGDYVEDTATQKLYRALTAHTSGATVDADVLAGNLVEVSPGNSIVRWATATAYGLNDYIEDPITHLLYRAVVAHTSGASVDADVIAGNLVEVSPAGDSTPLSYANLMAASGAVNTNAVWTVASPIAGSKIAASVGSANVTLQPGIYQISYGMLFGQPAAGNVSQLQLVEPLAGNVQVAGTATAFAGAMTGLVGGGVRSVILRVTTAKTIALRTLSQATVEPWMTIHELPEMSVVDPNLLVPETLAFVQVAGQVASFVANNVSIKFPTLVAGTIPYNPATGLFTLTGGKRYRLYSNVSNNAGGGAFWANSTGTALIPNTISRSNSVAVSYPNSIIYTPAATMDVALWSTANQSLVGSDASAYVEELASSSIVAIDPTLVVPQTLHRASFATANGNVTIPNAATTVGAGYFTMQLNSALFTTVHDPNNLRGANPFITIAQAGDYELSLTVGQTTWTPATILGIYVNGVRVAARLNRVQVTGPTLSLQVVKTLAAGDRVEVALAVSDAFFDPTFTVEQLPVYSVIDPGLVNVESHFTYSATEHLTGETWVDGKPVYRRWIDTSAIGGGALQSGVSTLISQTGGAISGTEVWPAPLKDGSNAYYAAKNAAGVVNLFRAGSINTPEPGEWILITYTKV